MPVSTKRFGLALVLARDIAIAPSTFGTGTKTSGGASTTDSGIGSTSSSIFTSALPDEEISFPTEDDSATGAIFFLVFFLVSVFNVSANRGCTPCARASMNFFS